MWSEDLKRRDHVQPKSLVWFDRCCQSDECGRVATFSVRFKLDENSYPKVCRASGSVAAFVASVPRRRRLIKAEAEIAKAVQTLGRCDGDAVCAAQRCNCEEGHPIASRQRATSLFTYRCVTRVFTRPCLRRCLSKTWKTLLMNNDMNHLNSFRGGL
jgi:hypothetical protein